VCRSLRTGFWPWADTTDPTYPVTWDNSYRPIKDPVHAAFLRQQCDAEVQLNQFSPSFGNDLLPGMYSMPVGVVPKPCSSNLRMVVDQSAEPFSQNSMIPKRERFVRMDNMHHLGSVLRRAHSAFPDRKLVVFKSDVSRAYRLMPVAPLWQIRQVVTIEGQCHVNRCNHFGNGAGGRVWASFASLLSWIAITIILIADLLTYVDDNFSWDFVDNLAWYKPYQKMMP
jgi:hypothetical protein